MEVMTSGFRARDFFVKPGIQPRTISSVIKVTWVEGGVVGRSLRIQPCNYSKERSFSATLHLRLCFLTLTSFLVFPGCFATLAVSTLVQANIITPSFEQSIFSTNVKS